MPSARVEGSRGQFVSQGRFYAEPLKLNASLESDYESVNAHVRRLRRRGSGSTIHSSLSALASFCLDQGVTPDALIAMEDDELSKRIQGYCDRLNARGKWQFAKTTGYRLQGFLRSNRRRLVDLLDLRYENMRSRREYVPTKAEAYRMVKAARSLRDQAIIATLVESGLRNSALRALSVGMVKDQILKRRYPVALRVDAELRRRDPDACKQGVEYWTFLGPVSTELLENYLKTRGRIEELDPEAPLFVVEGRNTTREQRASKSPSKGSLNKIVKEAAKAAGIKEWRQVKTHAMRKAFRSILDSGYVDGGQMADDDKEFIMGHRLPGQKAPYHNGNVELLAERYVKHSWGTAESSHLVDPRDKRVRELERQLAELQEREAEEDALARRLAQAMLRDPRLKEVLKEFTG